MGWVPGLTTAISKTNGVRRVQKKVLGTGYMYVYIHNGTGWRVDGEVFEEVKKIIKVHGFCYRFN